MQSVYFHQTLYRYGQLNLMDPQSEAGFWPNSTSIGDADDLKRWDARVRPWLSHSTRPSAPEASFFYAVFGHEAVLIRRTQQPNSTNAMAHLLMGPAQSLGPRSALSLRAWTWARLPRLRIAPLVSGTELQEHLAPLRNEAQAVDLSNRLIPLLSQVLVGPGPVVAPAGEQDLALLWGVCDILAALRDGLPEGERWDLGFETFDGREFPRDHSGLFLRFRDGAPEPQADPQTRTAARRLVRTYGTEGMNGLHEFLERADVLTQRTMADRIARTTEPPRIDIPIVHRPLPVRAETPMASPSPAKTTKTAPSVKGNRVTCPICLGDIEWRDLDLYSYDPNLGQYVPLDRPEGINDKQHARLMRTASVKCINPGNTTDTHYLPAGYGDYGKPAIYGFIGETSSGKTHLLSAMIGAIERGDLSSYGLSAQPIDLDQHRSVVRNMVEPLLVSGEWLPNTREDVVQFVDGFVISSGKVQRPMALYDVAGGELKEVENAKRFLEIADGLIFIVDPLRLSGNGGLGDPTFGTVLDLLRASGQLSNVSAAVVLNKADLLKFEDPISFWLRQEDDHLDPVQTLEESADVYAYLHQRGAKAWARPYRECDRATLHVASAVGTSAIERGARPMRVLKPLIALMAMTGMIQTPDAESIGI